MDIEESLRLMAQVDIIYFIWLFGLTLIVMGR